MELNTRSKDDCFLPDGAYGAAREALRRLPTAGRPVVVVYAFDRKTQMLPYLFATRYMMPAGVRLIGGLLAGCGFQPVRIVLQQWTPNFDVRRASLDGQPIQMLCISSMQIHSAGAMKLIRQAHELGPDRPLIIVGGPKAIYEPHMFFGLPPEGSVEVDAAVVGAEFILLQMLERIVTSTGANETLRQGFDRARRAGLFEDVPGLVYRHPDTSVDRPVLIHTGIQRFVRDLDELPHPLDGFALVERPHFGKRLRSEPLKLTKVGRYSVYASLVITHGCRYNCEYCPIPAYNQRTWRTKSPERLVREIQDIYAKTGIRRFFGTDDNFFNKRSTVEGYFEAMARATAGGKSFGDLIDFSTESTQFDTYKNRDLLPLARRGGLRALYFGIEDLAGNLVKKGQSPTRTIELFDRMCQLGISPMVLMMHYEGQPLRMRGTLAGLLDQAEFLYQNGAISYQCTVYSPALGTRALGPALKAGTIFQNVGNEPVPDACYDGNHVVASRSDRPWQQQWNLLRAYWQFYNPLKLVDAMFTRRDPCKALRIYCQICSMLSMPVTIWRYHQWVRKLKRGPITFWAETLKLPWPMRHVGGGPEPGGLVQLAIDRTRRDSSGSTSRPISLDTGKPSPAATPIVPSPPV